MIAILQNPESLLSTLVSIAGVSVREPRISALSNHKETLSFLSYSRMPGLMEVSINKATSALKLRDGSRLHKTTDYENTASVKLA